MALPNSTGFNPSLATDSTLVSAVDDRIIDVVQLIAEILGVDISTSRTVNDAIASFDATNGRWYELIVTGAATNNGFVIKDDDNSEQWRIRADGTSANSLIIERWEISAYVEYLTITDSTISFDGNELGTISEITAGTGLTGGGTSGEVTLSIDDGGVDTTQLADDAVTNAKIASDAAIVGTKFSAASITPAKIDGSGGTSGYVLTSNGSSSGWAKLGSVGIADDAINSDHIAAGAVDTAHISDDAVTIEKISGSGASEGYVMTNGASGPEWAAPNYDVYAREACRVYRSVDQTGIVYDTVTSVEFDAESYDTNDFHDNSTNNERLTIPDAASAGYYIVNAQVRLVYPSPAPDSDTILALYIIHYDDSAATTLNVATTRVAPLASICYISCSTIVALDEDDYVYVKIEHDINDPADTQDIDGGSPHTFMEIIKIGDL